MKNLKDVIDMNTIAHYTDINQLSTEQLSNATKMKIMGYLRHSDFLEAGVFANWLKNTFTDDPIPATGTFFNDDKWRWRDDLWLYVRDYDIKLPNDFIQDVLSFYEHQGTSPIPYQDRIVIYDEEDEFEKHHHGRKMGYYWHKETQLEIDKTKCSVEMSLMPCQFDANKRKVFFPILIFIEDNYNGRSNLYIKAEYHMDLCTGDIYLHKSDNSYTTEIERIIFHYISEENLPSQIDSFLERDVRAGMPIIR